jgi:hypothetical protein
MNTGLVWIFFRLAAIALVTFSLLSLPVARSNLDWGAGVLIGAISAGGTYWWLSLIRSRSNVDLSQPYLPTRPFLPMMKFPWRYWFVVSYSLAIGGAVTALRDSIEQNGHEGVGGSFLIVGLFIAVAVMLNIERSIALARRGR